MKDKNLDNIEALLFFALCALPPVAFLRPVGADEQFYLVKIALVELLVLLLAAVRLAGVAAGARGARRPPVVFIALAAWLALSVFIARNRHEAAQAALYVMCLPAAFWFAATFPDRAKLRAAVLAGTIAGACAAAVYGILDFADAAGPALFLDWGDRTASFFSDPNYFGLYLCVPLAACCGLLLFGNMKKPARAGAAVVCAVLFMALVLSNSRSGWAAMLCAAGVFAVVSALSGGGVSRLGRGAMMLGLLAALAVCAAAVTSAPFMKKYNFNLPARLRSIPAFPRYEADPRLLLWKSSRDMLASKPLTGYGIGNFYLEYHPFQLAYKSRKDFPPDPVVHSRHAYNDYLEMAAETGLPGLALWVCALAVMLAAGAAGAKSSGAVEQAAFAGCAAYILSGMFFQHPLHNAAGSALAFTWLGAVAVAQPGGAARAVSARAAAGVFALLLAACALLYVPRPVRGYMLFNRARKELAAGKAAKAASDAEAAIAADRGKPFPRLAAAQARLGTADSDPGALDRAQAHLVEFTRVLPWDSASRQMLGALYKRRGRYSDALEQYALAEKYSYGDTTVIRFEEAAALMSSFRYREAGDKLAVLAREADKRMQAVDLLLTLGHVREKLRAAGMNAKALTPEEMLQVKTYIEERKTMSRALFMRAVCLQSDGDTAAALPLLKRASELEPANRTYATRFASACIGLDAPECRKAPPPQSAGGSAADGDANVTFR